jgi:hypothetical protein
LSVAQDDGRVVLRAKAAEHDEVAIWSARRAAELLADTVERPIEIERA